MTIQRLSYFATLSVLLFVCNAKSSYADVIAATNFDVRTLTTTTIADDTATNLNWTFNGVNDPGDLVAIREDNAALAIFDGTSTTQVLFAPALNVGNSNIGWRTNVSLEASSGSQVTLTDVTFDYWAISGSQVLNVNRNSDFTITLYDPADVALDSVFIDNVTSGTVAGVPTITATFNSPILLDQAGMYRLEIFADEAPETGNHIGIDNLSINGTVTAAVVPEPTTILLWVLLSFGFVSYRRSTRLP